MDLHALQAFSPWSQHLLPSAAATLGREPLPVQTDHQGSLWEEKETQHRQLGARDKAGLSRALSATTATLPQTHHPRVACRAPGVSVDHYSSADIFTKGSLGLRLKSRHSP